MGPKRFKIHFWGKPFFRSAAYFFEIILKFILTLILEIKSFEKNSLNNFSCDGRYLKINIHLQLNLFRKVKLPFYSWSRANWIELYYLGSVGVKVWKGKTKIDFVFCSLTVRKNFKRNGLSSHWICPRNQFYLLQYYVAVKLICNDYWRKWPLTRIGSSLTKV